MPDTYCQISHGSTVATVASDSNIPVVKGKLSDFARQMQGPRSAPYLTLFRPGGCVGILILLPQLNVPCSPPMDDTKKQAREPTRLAIVA